MIYVDLNCDMGEGGSADEQLMPLISSCNIACGGHFGTQESMERAVKYARQNKVKIGAHPSYPDKDNFGRKPFDITAAELKETLKNQMADLQQIAKEEGERLHHVKPHGALYNEIVGDWKKARCVIDSVCEIDDELILFVPPKSIVGKLARGKLTTWQEGFADRNYKADYTLVSRQNSKALLTKKEKILQRVLSIAKTQKIETVNGLELSVDFDTICFHSDTENAVDILTYLNRKLSEENIAIL